MDHQTIEEHQIPERYLLGQLSPEEATRFEQHTLYCAQCQEQLETTEAMLDGLRTVAGEEAATVGRLSLLAWLAQRGRATQWALTATLVLSILVPSLVLWQRVGRLESALAQARSPRPANLLSLATQRNAGTEPTHQVALGGRSSWVVLALELDEVTAERYAVTLSDDQGHDLWTVRDLLPDHRATLPLTFPASTLAPGVYLLRVDAQPADPTGKPVPAGRYAFRAID